MTTTQDMINEHMRYEWRSGLKPLTKLDALRILASAYWKSDMGETASILRDKFGYVRRSMTLDDLKPTHNVYFDADLVERAVVNAVVDEGYNGRGPTWL
jgi:hypothetical protein